MALHLDLMLRHGWVLLYIPPSPLPRRGMFSSWYQVTCGAHSAQPPLAGDGHIDPLVRGCQISPLCVATFLSCDGEQSVGKYFKAMQRAACHHNPLLGLVPTEDFCLY